MLVGSDRNRDTNHNRVTLCLHRLSLGSAAGKPWHHLLRTVVSTVSSRLTFEVHAPEMVLGDPLAEPGITPVEAAVSSRLASEQRLPNAATAASPKKLTYNCIATKYVKSIVQRRRATPSTTVCAPVLSVQLAVPGSHIALARSPPRVLVTTSAPTMAMSCT